MKYGIIELHDLYDFDAPNAYEELVRCGECKFKSLYDEGETKYYYCALEDRPNRQWSVDDTDFCSWGERRDNAD